MLPDAGGPGASVLVTVAICVPETVDVTTGVPVGIGVDVEDGVPVAVAEGVPVVVAEGVPVVVAEGVPVVVAVPEAVAVADTLWVAVGVAARTWFVTVAVHCTSEPPPFAEPLHWSTFTGRVEVMVDAPVTVQANPTLVPPLPDPLHCPTVAALTEVTPGVFGGAQMAGAPGPVIAEPMHW